MIDKEPTVRGRLADVLTDELLVLVHLELLLGSSAETFAGVKVGSFAVFRNFHEFPEDLENLAIESTAALEREDGAFEAVGVLVFLVIDRLRKRLHVGGKGCDGFLCLRLRLSLRLSLGLGLFGDSQLHSSLGLL